MALDMEKDTICWLVVSWDDEILNIWKKQFQTTNQIWSWKIPSTPGAPGPRIAGNISRDRCWAPDRRCANTCTGNPRDHKGSKGVPNGNSPEMIQKKSKMDVLKNDEKWHIFKLSHFQS